MFAYVESYNSEKHTGYRFSLEKFENEALVYKLTADRIERDAADSLWSMFTVVERYIDNNQERMVKTARKDTIIPLKTTDLYEIKEDFEVMNFWELRHHIASENSRAMTM